MPSNAFRIVVTPPKSDGFHTIDDEHQAEIITHRIRESLTDAHIDADVRKVRHVPPPSRFHATPAEVDAFLREHFAEDILLRYQWAVGDAGAHEAAEDIARRADDKFDVGVSSKWHDGMHDAADWIDPARDGGHYPSKLVDFTAPTSALGAGQ